MRELRQLTLALWLLVIVIFGLIGCQRPTTIPGIVQGSSMAPNWLGEHKLLVCKDCQFPNRFQLDASDVQTKQIVCANCGYPDNPISAASTQSAQQATIHHELPISRWAVVAARLPDTNSYGIKRVVGLPNEEIEFRNGDLFADGKKLIKPWAVQKEIRIQTYDSRFQPTISPIGRRWTSEPASKSWLNSGYGWKYSKANQTEFRPVQGQERNWNWLKYQHWRGCSHRGNRNDLFPLEDIDTFNPSRPKSLNSMTDACFEIRFRTSSDAELAWRVYRGDEMLEFQLYPEPSKLCLLRRASNEANLDSGGEVGASTMETRLPEELIGSPEQNVIEISTMDGQLLVFINGHCAISQALSQDVDPADLHSPTNVFEIGGRQGEIEIEQVIIWRDIYYLPVEATRFSVPADSFYLLGDNVPVSIDSRHWKFCGIPQKDIMGIVKQAANR